jgi:hypothetical protein
MLSLPEIEAMAATWWVQKNEVDNLNIVLRKRKYVPYELTSSISLRAALFHGVEFSIHSSAFYCTPAN